MISPREICSTDVEETTWAFYVQQSLCEWYIHSIWQHMNLLRSVFGYEFCKSRLCPVVLMTTCTLHHSFLLIYFKQKLISRQNTQLTKSHTFVPCHYVALKQSALWISKLHAARKWQELADPLRNGKTTKQSACCFQFNRFSSLLM